MKANTAAQASLHPVLVGSAHRRIIEIASARGAVGWKVNGAGGEGGSLTILGPADLVARQAMIQSIEEAGNGVRVIPISLSADGVRRWESGVGITPKSS
jgi:D-glycero-alpha-D-manno-heptose-7-phosphate kinase